jgi:hypothetical protein
LLSRNFFSTTKKPYDAITEGLGSENSRGDKPAIELFWGGVQGWEGALKMLLDDAKNSILGAT